MVLEINNIFKSFNGLDVLENLSFCIDEGSITSIIGESGCGKTTLLRIMMGILEPTSGDVSGLPDGVGYVPQNLGLFPWRTVEGNIHFPLEVIKIEGSSVNDVVSLMGLSGFEKYYPKQLSGGMAQRAAIGRALITKPKILFLDEPFKSLDEITRNRLNGELKELWGKLGTTVVLITHSIREAICFSDKILVLSPRPATIKNTIKLSRNLTNMEICNYEKDIYNNILG
jgi:ABC-type nitrate/sulfonate/bicarbonate transport system ATPase subunit